MSEKLKLFYVGVILDLSFIGLTLCWWTQNVYFVKVVYIFLIHYIVGVLTFYLSDGLALLTEFSTYNLAWKIQTGKISYLTDNRE